MDYLKEGIEILKNVNHIKEYLPYDFKTFRGLMNITLPNNLDENYFEIEAKILENEYKNKKIIDVNTLEFVDNIALFKGDITDLKADAIVNAGNEQLLGCFVPLHNCIDNCIHSYAGLRVRKDLMEIMKIQNEEEKPGRCKVTKGYNLPSKYIFHTVGPKAFNGINKEKEEELKNSYLSCLKEADLLKLNTIVFPSISTGIYAFPIKKASKIAFNAVKNYLKENNSKLKVVFNLFLDEDYKIYEDLFRNN